MSQGKKGRPKLEQTKPLIFERLRSRVTRQMSMSAKTADDLLRYVTWAAAVVEAEEDEAMTLTLDQALGQFFQRDKLFQDALKKESESDMAGKPVGASPSPGGGSSGPGSGTGPASGGTIRSTPALPAPGPRPGATQ